MNKNKNGASTCGNNNVSTSSVTSAGASTNPYVEEDSYANVEDSDLRYGTGRSRYLAMKERRNRLARSRSSHQLLGNDEEDLTMDEPVSTTTVSPSAYLASRFDID